MNNAKRYTWNTPNDGPQAIGVENLGEGTYAVGYRKDGVLALIRTTSLPKSCNPQVAQRALDEFARKRGLKEVCPEAPHGATTNGSAWRTDLPDDEVTVLVRLGQDPDKITTATHEDGQWLDAAYKLEILDVTGCMHLADAAALLDAARPTA